MDFTMKMNFVLLIFLALSCQSNVTETQSQIAYQKGIELLQQASGNQEVVVARALEYFSHAVSIDSTYIEANLWKSQMGMFEKALQTANSAIESLEEENHQLLPNFYLTAGMAEIMHGNQSSSQEYLQKAFEIYSQRIKKDRNNIDAIGNKATILCYMGKKNEALTFLNSLAVSKENLILIEQMKADISEFDTDEAPNRLVLEE